MSGHGGNPGKFEPCRRFEVGFHNTRTSTGTFLVHPAGLARDEAVHRSSCTQFHPGTTNFQLGLQDRVLKAVPGWVSSLARHVHDIVMYMHECRTRYVYELSPG